MVGNCGGWEDFETFRADFERSRNSPPGQEGCPAERQGGVVELTFDEMLLLLFSEHIQDPETPTYFQISIP